MKTYRQGSSFCRQIPDSLRKRPTRSLSHSVLWSDLYLWQVERGDDPTQPRRAYRDSGLGAQPLTELSQCDVIVLGHDPGYALGALGVEARRVASGVRFRLKRSCLTTPTDDALNGRLAAAKYLGEFAARPDLLDVSCCDLLT
jgi:hypothetical protein